MKTARFSDVVARCGRPDPYTAWADPKADPAFQRAVKAMRILTVHQPNVGTSRDHGTIGFEPVPHALFLVFPKPLTPFRGRRVVGLDYEKITAPSPAPKSRVAKPARKKAPPLKPPGARRPDGAPARAAARRTRPADKMVPFVPPSPPEQEVRTPTKGADPATLTRVIRAAMREIKAGRVAAAYLRLEKGVKAAE